MVLSQNNRVKNKGQTVTVNSIIFLISFFIHFCGVSFTLFAQENIASKANVSTSKVSPWETLGAVNDGSVPISSSDKSHGLYGNWPSAGVWNWVEYSWNSYYVISRSEVYWFTDNGGCRIPDSSYVEYWDVVLGKWEIVPNHSGFVNLLNQYSIVSFDPIYSNKIRVHMKSNIESTGILEWKVFGEATEKLPGAAKLSISNDLALSATSTVTLNLNDSGNPVAGYNFVYDVSITNDRNETNENYLVNGISYSESALKVQLPKTDENGNVSFNVVMPATADPGDGISIQIFYAKQLVKVGKYSFYQAKLISPVVIADNSDNTVDFNFELTFTENAVWRNKIHKITIDSEQLNPAGYDITAGKITLKPTSLEKPLITSGIKKINIYSYGYENVSIEQEIKAGELSNEKTKVGTDLILTKSQSTKIYCEAKDKYSNPIKGVKLLYDVEITNNDPKIKEQYVLNGQSFSSSSSTNQMGNTSDKGYADIAIKMPVNIDINDGIAIKIKTETNQSVGQVSYQAGSSEKSIYLQKGVKNHSDFSWERTAQSENFILFWGSKIQGDPRNEINGTIKFDPSVILQDLEDLMYYWTDSIQFIQNPDEYTMGKYKFEVVLNETWSSEFTGWAFGGLIDDVISGMWLHPQAAAATDGVLAHEFGHGCQAMIFKQYPGYGLKTEWAGFFWESHTSFMAWFYHDHRYDFGLERFTMTSSMQYSSNRKYYQNQIFLQYLYEKYGMQTVNDIWRKADPKVSHPLTSLRDSVLRYTQNDLNDDFGHHAMRNVTWDYECKEQLNGYLNNDVRLNLYRTYTILDSLENMDDWFIVPKEMAPGDYGYNIIPFYPNDGASEVSIDFYGYDNAPSGGAGWRYGIVKVDPDGNAVYSDLYSEKEGTVNYTITGGNNQYFFVVSGAPQKHHDYIGWIGFPKEYRYPYRLRFNGALPAGYKKEYNSMKDEYPGAPHPNGGGWVATTAKVAATAYVGPNAQVLGNAIVEGNARIEDYAIVQDNARISGNAIIRDWAVVASSSVVTGNALVEKRARVRNNNNISENAIITGSAQVMYSTIKGKAVAKDLAFVSGVTLLGTAVLGGDSEHFNEAGKTTSAGIYLQVHNTAGRKSVDGLNIHEANIDVNPLVSDYLSPNGDYPSGEFNLRAENILSNSVDLKWDTPKSKYGIKEYYVFLNGSSVIRGTTTSNSFSLKNLIYNTSYTYKVIGIDSLGNYTPYSNLVTFKTIVNSVSPDLLDNNNFRIINYLQQKQVRITAPDLSQNNILEIYSISGQLIFKTSFVGEISVTHSAIGNSGIYLVKVNNSELKKNSKIFLNN